MNEPSLRLLEPVPGDGHAGEVYAIAFSSDSTFVLSGGWDGHLRLWDATSGSQVSALQVGQKPLSACAFGPNNRTWLVGSMEGLLSAWDAATHVLKMNFLAHTRPISSIRYSPDGQMLATASWDKQVALRKTGKEREVKTLHGHGDIVSGIAFTPDGKFLLSWSYDGSVILWDVGFHEQAWAPESHGDRVQGGTISPDGRWAVTASRDGELRLWDLVGRSLVSSLKVNGEVRGCWFLLDAESIVTVTADGWLGVLSAPGFEVRAEMLTGLKVECGDVAPSGSQLALGCADGHVRLVNVEGLEQSSVVITATESIQRKPTVFGRLLGKSAIMKVFHFTCPICLHAAETQQLPAQPFPCPNCSRSLRINTQVRHLQNQ